MKFLPGFSQDAVLSSLGDQFHAQLTVLYRLVYQYRDELEWCWEERFQPEYGALGDEVLAAFDAYLNCGIPLHGCARVECEKCEHSELIAFSCKRQTLCPPCDAKRALIFGEHTLPDKLTENSSS